MGHMLYRRDTMPVVFFRYSRVFFIPLLVLVPVIFMAPEIFFLFPLSLVFFTALSLVNFALRGQTQSIEFRKDTIAAIKRDWEKSFDIKRVKLYGVKVKGWRKGVCIEGEPGKTVIWKHEFRKQDWESIHDRLKSITPFERKVSDYTGLNYSGK